LQLLLHKNKKVYITCVFTITGKSVINHIYLSKTLKLMHVCLISQFMKTEISM